jgi:hypothetical protein
VTPEPVLADYKHDRFAYRAAIVRPSCCSRNAGGVGVMSQTHFTDPRHRTRKGLIFKNWVVENGRNWDERYQGVYDAF